MAEYPNRSDLRNPATKMASFTGQTYGEATQQQAAQRAVPAGESPQVVAAQQAASRPVPGEQSLMRPTERPNEPISTGANFGPGMNATQAGIVADVVPKDDLMERLIGLYQAFPNDDLGEMISKYRNRGY